jgi:ADP-ribose pyrophosphatase YjhB (NUDIX family)
MIRFENENNCFNYRVAGVAIHDDSVLLHRGEDDEFWVLPGGRAEFGEPASETLKREMREELNTEIEVVRLLWFVENFFTYSGRDYHELSTCFLMKLPEASEYLSHPGPYQGKEEDGTKLIFQWFPRQPEVLSRLPLLPGFLQTGLQELPGSVRHVVQWD